ncbi:MAG: hypothetical protein ACK4YP_09150 [Myxococcota bacterium]
MLLALATLACWRPDPYVPPEAPAAEVEAPSGEPGAEAAGEAPPDEAVAGEATAGEAPEGEGPAEEAPDPDPIPEDIEEQPAFVTWRARTVQAPVTLVDDWGKPLAVLGTKGWELEVRGEEPIRTRVWCGTCTPAVEGWIQAHLLERLP